MEAKIPISVVIITKNEESRITECLESVKWADEIVILDDYSTDKTIDVARQYTDKIFQRKMDIEGRHRNYAYSLAKNKWILSLDADERVTLKLRDELARIVTEDPPINGFAISRRNYIGDFWVRYGGWYPSAQIKLGQKEKFRFEEAEVHPRLLMLAPRGVLKSDIIHYSYKNFEDFLNKINNQTTKEAIKWYKSNRKITLFKALWRSADRFCRSFFIKKGYKDGFIGFVVAVFSSFYQILSYAKYWEMKRQKYG